MSTETIDPPTTSISLLIDYVGNKIRVKFTGSCLKQSNKLTYTHGKVVNIYIVYELGASTSNDNDPTLKSCLFGAVTLTENADIDNMDILVMELDLIEEEVFRFHVADLVNVLILGVDESLCTH